MQMSLSKQNKYIGNAQFNLMILISFFMFIAILQMMFFRDQFRPDEYKYIRNFFNFIFSWSSNKNIDYTSEFSMRILIFFLNICISIFLIYLRLIDRTTLFLFLVWPLGPYFFTKLHGEFYVYPLSLITPVLTVRREALVIAALAALFAITREGNLVILLFYRLCLLASATQYRKLCIAALIAAAVIGDHLLATSFNTGIGLIDHEIDRFNWTRNFENPEYSILETIMIIAAGFHFFTIHTAFWQIDAVFTILVIFLILSYPEGQAALARNSYLLLLVAAVIFFFTNITHSFQDSRYYFFFLPVIARMVPPRAIPFLMLFGFFHVVFKISEVIYFPYIVRY